ncbi:unnamed protein product [Pseudo-nitzschia multistriata]|uniref:Uncharacterized protein n=1 Tax=Pseudo-nitzschia multistriata TaxID=183589 RepID=A0A448YVM9_9STRA|nr:unnamed protein product [Pseudo-nitzschia multistriata]
MKAANAEISLNRTVSTEELTLDQYLTQSNNSSPQCETRGESSVPLDVVAFRMALASYASPEKQQAQAHGMVSVPYNTYRSYTPTVLSMAQSVDESWISSEHSVRRSAVKARQKRSEQRVKSLIGRVGHRSDSPSGKAGPGFPSSPGAAIAATPIAGASATATANATSRVMEAVARNINHLAASVKPRDGEKIVPLSNHRGACIFDVERLETHLRKHGMILLQTAHKEHNLEGSVLEDVARKLGRSVSVAGDASRAAAAFVGSLEAEFGLAGEKRNAFAQFGREVQVASVLLPNPCTGHDELRALLTPGFRAAIDAVATEEEASEFLERIGPFYVQAAFFGALYVTSASAYSYKARAARKIRAAMKSRYERLAGRGGAGGGELRTGDEDSGDSSARASALLRSWTEEGSGAEVGVKACGGDPAKLASRGGRCEWSESAKEDPSIVRCDLVPIYELAVAPAPAPAASTDCGANHSRRLLKAAFDKYAERQEKLLSEWSDAWKPERVDIRGECETLQKLGDELRERRARAKKWVDGVFSRPLRHLTRSKRDTNWLSSLDRCLEGWDEHGTGDVVPGISEIEAYAENYHHREPSHSGAVLIGLLDTAGNSSRRHRNESSGPFGRDTEKSNEVYQLVYEKCQSVKQSIQRKVHGSNNNKNRGGLATEENGLDPFSFDVSKETKAKPATVAGKDATAEARDLDVFQRRREPRCFSGLIGELRNWVKSIEEAQTEDKDFERTESSGNDSDSNPIKHAKEDGKDSEIGEGKETASLSEAVEEGTSDKKDTATAESKTAESDSRACDEAKSDDGNFDRGCREGGAKIIEETIVNDRVPSDE